jgi:histidinol-phosphate aminotransferase
MVVASDLCNNPLSCWCARKMPGQRIIAKSNSVGPGIVNYAPALRAIALADPELNFRYCEANNDRDPVGLATRRALAQLEGVDVRNVTITGSLLELFGVAPQIFECRTRIKIVPDFNGYFNRTGATDVAALKVPVDIDADSVSASAVAEVVRRADRPLVFLTFPITNPGQQVMSLEVAEAALMANDKAIVVLDNAYRGVGEIEGLAQFALSNDRTLYVNTAAKDLYLSGARFGWAIGSKSLLAKLAGGIPPYGVSPLSLEQGRRLLALPDALRSARLAQATARDILVGGLRALGVRMRSGLGTWVLLYFGAEAVDFVEKLADSYQIDVQLQPDDLKGWVRISATIPCEARQVVNAVTKLLQFRHMGKLRQQLSDQIIRDVRTALANELAAAWSPII